MLVLLPIPVIQNAIACDLVDNLARWTMCKEMESLDDR
jgi:hypothetical protein